MILVCGGVADSVTELVCARLKDCGYAFRFLDLGIYPSGYKINWHWKNNNPEGYISGPDWRLNLNELTGVYVRFLGTEARIPNPNLPTDVAQGMYFEYDTGLMLLLEHLKCVVLNRINGGMSNSSKVYQGLMVRKCGLLTPPTLVTNDPKAVHRFYDEFYGEVIYKSLSGIRSIVKKLDEAQLERLSLLQHGPAQFQALIPGENIRVHTVGNQKFSTLVHSDVVDYRYAGREGGSVHMEETELPSEISEACSLLAKELDLLLSGIDLKLTPDGKYYCFEINPSPGFLYYEKRTLQPISLAIANLLQNGN